MTAEHPLDPEALAGLRALDPAGGDAVVREIAAIFLEDTPGRLAELEAAASSGNSEKFIRAAHSLKGGAAALGASKIRHAADRAESEARKNGLAAGAAALPDLHAAWRASEPHLRRLLS